MNKTLIVAILALSLAACHQVKEKTTSTIKKTGETIAEGTSEFVKGVRNGIDKAFDSEVDISEALADKGVDKGKTLLTDSSGKQNVIAIYLIFNQDFSGELTVKAYDKDGLEYGRTKKTLTAKKGDAGYVDFYFPGRTMLEGKSKFTLE